MADLIITKYRDRAVICPNNEVGKKWIENNMLTVYGTAVTIQADLLEDFINNIEADFLTYEER